MEPGKDFKIYPELNTTDVSILNSKSKEPTLAVGATTSTVAGILSIVAVFFPNLLDENATKAILLIVALFLPFVTAMFIRGKVWSPASVKEVVDEAVQNAEAVLKSRGPN